MLLISTLGSIIEPGNDGEVYVFDHQPPMFWEIEANNEGVYIDKSYNAIEAIIKEHNINVEHVYMNNYLHRSDMLYDHTCLPWWFLMACDQYLKDTVDTHQCSDGKNCFVMMNKRRENRLLVSAWFSQNRHIDFDYTQAWEIENEHFVVIDELLRLTPYKFDSFLEKKFISSKEKRGSAKLWNDIFIEKFCSSTFSIITEPVFWEKGCTITEKYLMAVYGCCFPIFCGGYAMPEQLTRIGFDVFDDVIDHSYQYEAHPSIRVLNALELNRELLENHSVKKLDYMDRHRKNLSLVRDNLDIFKSQFNTDIDQFNKHYSISSRFNNYEESKKYQS